MQPEIIIPQPSATELHIQSLQSEIQFLRDQVKLLQERSTPQIVAPKIVQPLRPQKWDETVKKYVPKTDEEIHNDHQGLVELGII